MASDRDNPLFVVAIDFGTTYSGYAFSSRSENLTEKTNIHSPIWNSGQLLSHKSPTILLLNKEKQFVDFGYDAENCYSGMTEENRKEHYYFHRFKMMLYTKDKKMAGIRKKSLLICLEPEAASIYCKWISIEKDNNALVTMKPGRRFLVLDAGGGTIDMAMQEVRDDEKLQEINRAEGGDWGGIYVDEEFKQMLEGIVSKPVIEAFRMKYTVDYIELFRFFERKKREKTGKSVRIQIPQTLLDMADDIAKQTKDQGLKDEVELKRDKLLIKHEKFIKFFNKVADKIVLKVEEMLVSDTAKGTKVIIMVGGFSENEFLQSRIRDSFPSCTVVIPQECGLAVLKGAVIFGHDPDIVAARIVKYTYGVRINTPFNNNKHPESKKILINGKEYCTDKFDIHVSKGKLIYCNEETNNNYSPLYEDQTSVKFRVFVSDKEYPQYTDEEGCKEIGSLTVPMPDTTGGTNRTVNVKFKFGATKITVEGFDNTSKKSVNVKIDFLENNP